MAYGIYGAVGIELALSVVGGALLGRYLDRRFGWEPWATVTGLVLGSVVGFYQLFRLLRYKEKLDSKDQDE